MNEELLKPSTEQRGERERGGREENEAKNTFFSVVGSSILQAKKFSESCKENMLPNFCRSLTKISECEFLSQVFVRKLFDSIFSLYFGDLFRKIHSIGTSLVKQLHYIAHHQDYYITFDESFVD